MARLRKTCCSLIACLAAVAAGCEQAAEMVDTVGKKAQEVRKRVERRVEEVKQTANLAGQIELALNPPVKVKACYASLIVVDDARPAVLQVASYLDSESEAFPSVFMRAEVPAGSAAALAGMTVTAQVFVQPRGNGPVWHSRAPQHVQLRIDEASDGSIKGTLVGGQLVSTQAGQPMDIRGSFSGSLK